MTGLIQEVFAQVRRPPSKERVFVLRPEMCLRDWAASVDTSAFALDRKA